jgi:Fic family protein
MAALERFIHDEHTPYPTLVKAALAHVQFETIHPFLDGNGRVGRLLVTFLLCHRKVLSLPLLYLSYFFKKHRAEYYDRLMAIREAGDWEGWLRFFLRGVEETAKEATATAGAIVETREKHYATVHQSVAGNHGARLLELLFARPLTTINVVSHKLGVHYVTASKLIDQFVELGLLVEITGRKRDRIFSYDPYLALFRETDEGAPSEPLQTTEAPVG